jgi:hemerythrin-like metal-binding protein
MQWDEKYSIGIPSLDSQHKQLFRLITELEDAMQTGLSKAQLIDLLERLHLYAVRHFRLEERMMQNAAYPGLPKQEEEHNYFVSRMTELRGQLENEGLKPELANTLRTELVEWTKAHIPELDKAFADFQHQSQQDTRPFAAPSPSQEIQP